MSTPLAPPDGWTVSAAVAPASAAPPAANDQKDPTLGTPREWAKGAEAVRSTVKWLVTALAAVGAFLFAKGFVSTPELSWTENRDQLRLALISGGVGLLGLGYLIAKAVDILRPHMYELHRLPADYVKVVEGGGAGVALPTDCPTVESVRDRLQAFRRATFDNAEEIAEINLSALSSKQEKRLAVLQRERRLLLHNLAVYEAARTALLDGAEYHTLSRGVSGWRAASMILAGVVAAAGGIGYALSLASAETDTPPAAPVVGEMVQVDSEAGSQLWSLLGLAGCQAAADSPRIPVVVGGGDGSTASPYSVTTLPTSTCRAQTFTVTDAAALVSVPKSVKITYAPSTATPTPR
ncbi:hypothetical protein KMZ32_09475 [Phycicoccus sp. MAQZ13P-2]|uniref:hypothetical protein n=1 Tax=Phycicoccus mangrovi TaxID=2840470 RepID=UPI001C0048FD|nr:hypothetical protein [Phycicoccus mangrovi]MBT9255709.1 hypothetical protein [Phycicoccus mangrovi]MBT9274303.1 hypothetical protein [Phycicoccus mangrovi]